MLGAGKSTEMGGRLVPAGFPPALLNSLPAVLPTGMVEAPPDPETVLVLGKIGFQLGLLLAHSAYLLVYEGAALPLWHKVAIKVISKRKVLEEDLRKLLPQQMQTGGSGGGVGWEWGVLSIMKCCGARAGGASECPWSIRG